MKRSLENEDIEDEAVVFDTNRASRRSLDV